MSVALALKTFGGELNPSGALVTAAAIPALLALLFVPAPGRPTGGSLFTLGGWCVGVLLVAGANSLLLGVDAPAIRLASVGALAFLLLFNTHLVASLLQRLLERSGLARIEAREWSTWSVAALLWLAASAPVWLGPLADVLARSNPEAPAAIVGISPLSHLAVAAGHDLLRNEWFYAHSPIGSLQFDYPSAASLFLTYIAAAVLLALLGLLAERTSHGDARVSRPTITLEQAG